MLIVISLILILILLPDCYISMVMLKGVSWPWQALFWSPTVLLFGSMCLMMATGRNALMAKIVFYEILLVALPQLVFVVCSLLGRGAALAWPAAQTCGNIIGLAAGATIVIALAYGMLWGWRSLEVKHLDLTFDTLPESFDGYKLVQFSDLHSGSFEGHSTFVQQLVDTINAQDADMVLFTGDIINTHPDELQPLLSILSQVRARDGIYSVLGNHDYCLFGFGKRPADPREGARQVVEMERDIGWSVLLNEHHLVVRGSDTLAIIGVENTGKPPFPEIGDLRKASEGVAAYHPSGQEDTIASHNSIFPILLTHDPSHWRMEVLPCTDIPLTLSGHTHAAQIKIGRWSPARWMYHEWAGLYTQGSQSLFVSQGIGGSFRMRLGARPEVVVISLHSGTNKSTKNDANLAERKDEENRKKAI